MGWGGPPHASSRRSVGAGAGCTVRSLLTARACWTMDSLTGDAMASESSRAPACDASQSSAAPCATRRTPCRRRMPAFLDLGARAKEPEQRCHGGVERARHLSDEHPHLAALGERVAASAYCPLCGCDIALARCVVEQGGRGRGAWASMPRSAQPSAVRGSMSSRVQPKACVLPTRHERTTDFGTTACRRSGSS